MISSVLHISTMAYSRVDIRTQNKFLKTKMEDGRDKKGMNYAEKESFGVIMNVKSFSGNLYDLG